MSRQMSQVKVTLKSELFRVIKFSFVGLANSALDYVVFLLCFYYLNIPILWSNFFAFCCAVCLSYYLNSRYTFPEMAAGNNLVKLTKYFLIAYPAFLVSTAVVYYLSVLIPVYLAKLAAMLVSLAINYTLSRAFVFK